MRTVANHCERRRTTANGGERSRTAANARERLFFIRFLTLRMARIVVFLSFLYRILYSNLLTMLILLFVRGFIFLKKFKLSTFLDFRKKQIFLKTFFSFSIIKRTNCWLEKNLKKKFYAILCCLKLNFYYILRT